jgi:hypothetical protein
MQLCVVSTCVTQRVCDPKLQCSLYFDTNLYRLKHLEWCLMTALKKKLDGTYCLRIARESKRALITGGDEFPA